MTSIEEPRERAAEVADPRFDRTLQQVSAAMVKLYKE
jgi:hypothetical protein